MHQLKCDWIIVTAGATTTTGNITSLLSAPLSFFFFFEVFMFSSTSSISSNGWVHPFLDLVSYILKYSYSILPLTQFYPRFSKYKTPSFFLLSSFFQAQLMIFFLRCQYLNPIPICCPIIMIIIVMETPFMGL